MTSEVTSEDQVKINKFAILHDKYGVIKGKLAQKHRDLQNVADASDAVDEYQITGDSSDECILMRAGFLHTPLVETFFHCDASTASTKIGALKSPLESEIAALERENAGLRTQMDALRAPLIAKLGRTINLDYEAEDAEEAAVAAR